MKDFQDPMELLDVEEEKITFQFELQEGETRISMMLGGAKTFFPIRHLVQIIFGSDRIFDFRVLGFVDALRGENYTLKPISIVYL
jgi:hypothetical protein